MADLAAPMVPPMLYLPIRDNNGQGPVAEIRQLADGRNTILAYSALDRLTAGCGSSQPWVIIRTEDLAEIKAAQPFEVVSLDITVPDEYRRNDRLV